jgi:prepilin-type N-terminal cleavage/methylation domain-containing protein/prepilin-type processing-associated H-X9-DG protein
MKSFKGFTLIELLVVIAIIALLLSVIIPALKNAKRLATAAACLANQHGLITGWCMYADDYGGRITDADTASSDVLIRNPWAHPPLTEEGTYLSSPDQEVTLEDRLRGIRAGALFGYVETIKAYHCPNDKRLNRGTNYGTSDAYKMYRSYNIQGGLNGEEIYRSSKGICPTNVAQLKASGNIYVFVEEYYDGALANYNGGSWQIDRDDNGESWWNIMAIWHNESSTLSFADGHAERLRWNDPRTIEYAESRGSIESTQPGNPDLMYMIKNYAVPLPRER